MTTLLGIYHPLPLRCAVAQAGFRPGDRLVLYTDGLIESRDDAGNEFGMAGLQAFTEAHPELSSQTFNQRLSAAAHCEGGLRDPGRRTIDDGLARIAHPGGASG